MRLVIKAEAEDDLARIHEFNLERSESWADKVEQRLLDRAEALLGAPWVGRAISKAGLRRLSVTDIQYVIDYRVLDDAVEVARFQSTREIR